MYTLLPENIPIAEQTGLLPWMSRYNGSRGYMLTAESFTIPSTMTDNVTRMFPELPVSDNSHGYFTADTVLQFMPQTKIVQAPFAYNTNSDGTIYGPQLDRFITWCNQNHPDAMYRSLESSRGMDSALVPLMAFCSFVNSAGNQGSASYATAIEDLAWLGVGAIESNLTPTNYTSVSDYVDYCSFGSIMLPATVPGVEVPMSGTSFSGPIVATQIHTLNQMFIEYIGRSLPQLGVEAFLQKHSTDLYTPGKDNKTGWGIPVLPHPDTMKIIELTLNSTNVNTNGQISTLTLPPTVRDTRTFVPIRFVAEQLGYDVVWVPEQPTLIRIIKGSDEMRLTIGSTHYLMNGIDHTMDVAPYAENNTTMVPIRFIAEAFGAIVNWHTAFPDKILII
jgi:hypothetical protein